MGSREFRMRLMEVIVTICHDLSATMSSAFGGGLHKPDPSGAFPGPLPQPPNGVELEITFPQKPTELFHSGYYDWEQYPRGVADMVGYWAEYQLFGGVVLFDRGETGDQCNNVFIHPVGRYKIFQLSEMQLNKFLGFVLSELPIGSDISLGLPFSAEKYGCRIDPYEAMGIHIYRSVHERRSFPHRPVRCVGRAEDEPDYAEALQDLVRRSQRPGPRGQN